jgi:dTDP-4-dehydrorhamnose reductase
MKESESEKPLAWVTGAGGLIGNQIVETAIRFAPSWRLHALKRGDLDLLDFEAVQGTFEKEQPQLIVHCAALSKTPDCEADPALARKLNVDVTKFLADLAADIPLVFFSTDLVFDGRKGNYVESDRVNPISVYGETKAAAEKLVLTNPKHTVIRTSLNSGTSPTGDRAFDEQLRRLFQRGATVKLFTDEFRSPIAAIVTARSMWELVSHNATGIYHVAGSERMSRWQIGQLIAARCPELHPKIEAESLANYRGAPRAPDTSLNCAKAHKLLTFPLPGFREWLNAGGDSYRK